MQSSRAPRTCRHHRHQQGRQLRRCRIHLALVSINPVGAALYDSGVRYLSTVGFRSYDDVGASWNKPYPAASRWRTRSQRATDITVRSITAIPSNSRNLCENLLCNDPSSFVIHIIFCAAILAHAQAQSPSSLSTSFQLVSFDAVRVSPDGNSVVIGAERADWDQKSSARALLYRTASSISCLDAIRARLRRNGRRRPVDRLPPERNARLRSDAMK